MKIIKCLQLFSTLLVVASCSPITNSGSFINGFTSNEQQSSCSSKEQSNNSLSPNNSNNSSIVEPDYFEINTSDKYVVGKRIFDFEYCEYVKESFAVEEIPNAVFEYSKNSGCALNIDDETSLETNYALYVADVNQDGNYDVVYTYVRGSGDLKYGVGIYDFFNKKSLFSSSGYDFMFDLDDNNLLVLEEFEGKQGSKFYLKEAKRILKKSEENIEFETFDLENKVKGFVCGDFDVPTIKKTSEINRTFRIAIQLYYFVKNYDDSVPLETKDIEVTCDDKTFSCSIEKEEEYSYRNFIVVLVFSEAGDKEVVIKIGQCIATGIISVFIPLV